jgi:hypothetical protein
MNVECGVAVIVRQFRFNRRLHLSSQSGNDLAKDIVLQVLVARQLTLVLQPRRHGTLQIPLQRFGIRNAIPPVLLDRMS